MAEPNMPNTVARRCFVALAGSLAALLVAACTTQTTKTQAFSRIDRIESDLQRGTTTKADVLLSLGEPDGAGALGGFDALRDPEGAGKGPIDAWYYESVKASIMGGLRVRQDILLVFFDGDTVDGFFWFSNKSAGEME